MTETIRAIIMTAAALAPMVAWLVVPGITFARLTGLAVCAVVVVGVGVGARTPARFPTRTASGRSVGTQPV